MGRLTLNILLSFAQSEREITGERIRDKIGPPAKKGMFMGGNVPLRYEVKDRKLLVNEPDATVVRSIFDRFLRIGSATALARELRREGVRTKRGRLVDKGYLYTATTTSSPTAAPPGTTSSTSPGTSDPSDDAPGPKGSNQCGLG